MCYPENFSGAIYSRTLHVGNGASLTTPPITLIMTFTSVSKGNLHRCEIMQYATGRNAVGDKKQLWLQELSNLRRTAKHSCDNPELLLGDYQVHVKPLGFSVVNIL